jgi:FkbM family methyltransferase
MQLKFRVDNLLAKYSFKAREELVVWLSSKRIFIVGRNNETLQLTKLFNVDGIIDDFYRFPKWENITVFSSEQVNKDSLIINTSTSISPNSVKRVFSEKGFKYFADLFELFFLYKNLSPPVFTRDTIFDYENNYSKWQNIYELLSDNISVSTIEDILLFRLTCNPFFMEKYNVRLNEQYMEAFMDYNNEIMVDVGGYDGDTTEQFCLNFRNYQMIHFFEPSLENFINAKTRLEGFDRINFINAGLSDKEGSILYEDHLGSSSKVSEFGEISIYVNKLDNLLKEKVSFIKMDIEGWEIPALMGCKKHIIDDHPKLAIAVYHKAEDIWKIPELILSFRKDYDIFLRHYTEGWSETVMYFKPKK